MMQREFAYKAKEILEGDEDVIGLAVVGSWLTDELDEFSDLDLILVTKNRVSDNKLLMLEYANRLGDFLSGFTGEHIGEPRVLICLYDNPLLHVDIKFLTLDEFHSRIETPVLLIDKEGKLEHIILNSVEKYPFPDYQWIEDRFWTWVHYVLLKIGRGEYMEAYDFMSFLRIVVLGPLLHIKNDNLPRGVRKVETALKDEDFVILKSTMPNYDRTSIIISLRNAVTLYQRLRKDLYNNAVQLQKRTEEKVMDYFNSKDFK